MRKFEKIKDTVIFDLDGTLLDTLDDLMASINHALSKNNMPTHSKEAVRSFVGNGVYVLIEKSLPTGTDEKTYQKVLEDFKAYYSEHSQDMTRLYDGIIPLIQSLKSKGYRIAIVSNKHDAAVQQLLNVYFEGLVNLAIGQQDGVARKPAPDSVFLALDKLGSKVSEAVYVGDSEVDLMTAKAARMDYIIVTWGFRSKEMLKELGAEIFVSNPSEILSILEG